MGNSNANVAPVDSSKHGKVKCEGDSCKLEAKEAKPLPTQTNGDEPKKLKPCCACPETKKARDTWYYLLNKFLEFAMILKLINFYNINSIIEKGEENCKDLIEAHKECMRKLGFII